MKNKIQLIDVSIISLYMGRWLTLGVFVVVISITISAILSGGGGATRNVISICAPFADGETKHERVYEPFRSLLSRETRRPVVVTGCQDAWPSDHDLYIMPVHEYLRRGKRMGIVAIVEMSGTERQNDSAVIIARSGDGTIDLSTIAPGDIAFADPTSVNGFWVPLSALTHDGFNVPADPSRFRFERGSGAGERIVMGVLFGAYRLGACRLTEIDRLTERGVIDRSEVRVLRREDALPEVVIAARADEADYYRGKLVKMNRLLTSGNAGVDRNDTTELLKSLGIKGLRPLDPVRLAEVEQLYELYREYF